MSLKGRHWLGLGYCNPSILEAKASRWQGGAALHCSAGPSLKARKKLRGEEAEELKMNYCPARWKLLFDFSKFKEVQRSGKTLLRTSQLLNLVTDVLLPEQRLVQSDPQRGNPVAQREKETNPLCCHPRQDWGTQDGLVTAPLQSSQKHKGWTTTAQPTTRGSPALQALPIEKNTGIVKPTSRSYTECTGSIYEPKAGYSKETPSEPARVTQLRY